MSVQRSPSQPPREFLQEFRLSKNGRSVETEKYLCLLFFTAFGNPSVSVSFRRKWVPVRGLSKCSKHQNLLGSLTLPAFALPLQSTRFPLPSLLLLPLPTPRSPAPPRPAPLCLPAPPRPAPKLPRPVPSRTAPHRPARPVRPRQLQPAQSGGEGGDRT